MFLPCLGHGLELLRSVAGWIQLKQQEATLQFVEKTYEDVLHKTCKRRHYSIDLEHPSSPRN